MKAYRIVVLALAATGAVAALPGWNFRVAAAPSPSALKLQAVEAYGKIPMQFEANEGQTDEQVRFLSRGGGYTMFLTRSEAVLVLAAPFGAQQNVSSSTILRMKLLDANRNTVVSGQEELPGKVNYFTGSNARKWQTGIRTYTRVKYEDVFPGVDLVYYGRAGQLEYDFVVAPGADPRTIALGIEGAGNLEVDARGDLVLHVAHGQIRQRKPVIYQEIDGVRRDVSGGYVLEDKHQVRIHVGAYDRARPLVIDPVLLYSTYLGGGGDDLSADIALDSAGNAYATGWTFSADFPATPGSVDGSLGGTQDAFVTKLNPAGSAIVYSSYLGGSDIENGNAIAVDDAGNAWLAGATRSSDFPTTMGAFDTSFNGDADGFVVKIDPSGSTLLYSTYLGGSELDTCHAIALDAAGNAFVTGRTLSSGFPITMGSWDTSLGGSEDAFVTKVNATGAALVFSTYLGGSFRDNGNGITVDAAGDVYLTGDTVSGDFPTTLGAFDTMFDGTGDAFVTKLNAAGTGLLFSTFLGGPGNEIGIGVRVDSTLDTYVSGHTFADGFPVTLDAFDTSYNGGPLDVFVAKFNAAGTALIYSTYLGGSGSDFGFGLQVDSAGNTYVAGETRSPDFPTTMDAFQSTAPGGFADAFLTKLDAAGSTLLYSTYLGTAGDDRGFGLAVNSAGSAYVVGDTDSAVFPTTPGSFDTSANGGFDVFVAKIGDEAPEVSCSVTLSALWPPNHPLVNVGLSVNVADDTDPNPVISVSTFGDEDDVEPTDEVQHSPDAKDIAVGTLRLRAERKGDGDGRVYLIIATATDNVGNVGFGCCTVTVPLGLNPGAIGSVTAQATGAAAVCQTTGAPPPGYFIVGDGPVIGPHQ